MIKFEDSKNSKWFKSKDLSIDDEGKHIVKLSRYFPLITKHVHFYMDSKLTHNYHDYLEITYANSGEGVLEIGDKKVLLYAGDLFFINNVDLHTVQAKTNKPLDLISIFFLPELLFKPGDHNFNIEFLSIFYNRDLNFLPHIQSNKVLKDIPLLISKIHQEINRKERLYRIKTKTYLQDILISLVDYFRDKIQNTNISYKKKYIEIERLKSVFILIHKDFENPISLTRVAKEACMSPNYFCRFFKRVTGLTFTQYLINIRIDKAKELILKNNMSITNIAFKVGFENLGYFYRAFKKYTGYSPKEYREVLR